MNETNIWLNGLVVETRLIASLHELNENKFLLRIGFNENKFCCE